MGTVLATGAVVRVRVVVEALGEGSGCGVVVSMELSGMGWTVGICSVGTTTAVGGGAMSGTTISGSGAAGNGAAASCPRLGVEAIASTAAIAVPA